MGPLRRSGPLLRQPLPGDDLDTSGAQRSKQEPSNSVTAPGTKGVQSRYVWFLEFKGRFSA